ncbi:OmpP1/FadL family transporter [Planctomycetota bacterium]
MKLFNRRGVSIAFSLILVCVGGVVSTAVADGIIRDGVGAISTSRGGTNLGFADNGSIILDNPGAMVNLAGDGLFELGADMLITDLSYSDPDNTPVSSSNNPFPMGQVSLIRRLANENIAVGLGAFSQAGFSTHYIMNGQAPFPGERSYKSVGAMMRILPSVSLALTERLSVGATLGVAVSHTELEGPYVTQAPTPLAGTPTLLDLQATGAGLSWSVGLQYLLTPQTTVGFLYQGATHIDAQGSARLTHPALGSSAYELELNTEWPSTLGLGLAHEVNPCTTVAVDVLWTAWSGAKDGYGMTLSDPTNPLFRAVLGPQVPERFPLSWKDSVAVRTGVQRRLGNGKVVRAGYVYHPNPIPDETLTPFIQATVEHSVSVGYGWQWAGYSIDLGYQHMFGPSRTVAQSSFLGGDFDGSRSSAAAHWLLTSISRRF